VRLSGGLASAPFIGVIAALCLIGGLATACFTKAFGAIFLGEPRSGQAAQAHEAGPLMRCLDRVGRRLSSDRSGGAGRLGRLLGRVLAAVSQQPLPAVQDGLSIAVKPLWAVVSVASGLGVLTILLPGCVDTASGTPGPAGRHLGCAFAQPSARMQYTASSFVQPLTSLFRSTLQSRRQIVRPRGSSPRGRSGHGDAGFDPGKILPAGLCRRRRDAIEVSMAPAGAGPALRPLHHGTLLILLVWKLG